MMIPVLCEPSEREAESASSSAVDVAHTEADVTDDDVRSAYAVSSTRLDGIASDTDTVTRSRLAKDGEVARVDFQDVFEVDSTCYIEDDGTCARLIDSVA